MRFSATAVLALPLLAAAAESPFDAYKAKFQNFLSSFGAAVPIAADKAEPVAAASSKSKTKIAPKNIDTLTLHDWQDKLFAPLKGDETTPEEWWVLITGGNKTCFGHCGKVEAAFNESAVKFATLSKSPHLAVVNCDEQPILCNSWSAGTGALWLFEMLPRPAPIEVYWKPLNLSTTTTQTLLDLYAQDSHEAFRHYTHSYFHPFQGKLAQYGLAVPVAYAVWALNLVPSWAMMLIVSFFSRSMMNRNMGPPPPRAAPAGDAR